ncbi:OLC1v1021539C3 [Oldenlandia corymbosa var. corymbosa]|uniref:OLC1v1021539C3 n=1 Tax=Oldenlandia corymbosa var. corymbosa TaxID=529605 RepID=A0AAV1BVX1_OLDCO|nr:OLC1v1021539C3 [Oldenlandia corymbosa var. corymbosa]
MLFNLYKVFGRICFRKCSSNSLGGNRFMVSGHKSQVASIGEGRQISFRIRDVSCFSTIQRVVVIDGDGEKENGNGTLAMDLASLVEDSSVTPKRKPRTRAELQRFLELRIKKRVKEQYRDGKFYDLMEKVIANSNTLRDAYDLIRVSSNIDLTTDGDNLPFESMADELLAGNFNVDANTYSMSTRGKDKEVLVFPNVKLKVVQEAIKIALEVVYRPHFSKISHGGRSGRDHSSALRYIRKEMHDSNWWFTLHLNQKLNSQILDRLIHEMQHKVEDSSLYAIIRRMFDSKVLNLEFGGFPKGHGLPQEGVLSPILTNIYLDVFDREIYRMSMTYEALDSSSATGDDGINSKLRGWFRRQMNGNITQEHNCENGSSVRLHCCRFLDEIFVAIAGPKDVALSCKSEIENFLKNLLYLGVCDQLDVLPCESRRGVRFLGTLIKRSVKESPAVRAVHKLKDKVALFASQKQRAWDTGTVRIGKKWIAHGLKKVKESEIKHLTDRSSLLNQISCFRKAGMETDHWYRLLLKIWMQNNNARNEESVESILSRCIVEPSLPQELKESYEEFQKRAREYVSSETTATVALLPGISSAITPTVTEIVAPIGPIKKRLQRYGVTNAEGQPRLCHILVLQDEEHIIGWFSGIVDRWLRWYKECDNFNEIKLIISGEVRMSCIRTLAAKYRIHETEIEKKFDLQLSRIPVTRETEQEITDEDFDNADSLSGGTYSGLCLLSLARTVSKSRPCNCFVIGCTMPAPCVYTLHVMEQQKFPGWKTGFSSCIHPGLHRRRIGLCRKHVKDLFLGHISLQSVNFGAWT